MIETVIIGEYLLRGRAQVLLERYKDEQDHFRVITVKQTRSKDSALKMFLDAIPEAQREYYRDTAEHNMKRDAAGKVILSPRPQEKRKPLTPPKQKKGKRANAKDQQATA